MLSLWSASIRIILFTCYEWLYLNYHNKKCIHSALFGGNFLTNQQWMFAILILTIEIKLVITDEWIICNETKIFASNSITLRKWYIA